MAKVSIPLASQAGQNDIANAIREITRGVLDIERAEAAADSAEASATSAAGSASDAAGTAAALTAFIQTKQTLTAPAVDRTLTVSGAAADAAVAGNGVINWGIGTFNSCNAITKNSVYFVSSSNNVLSIPDFPLGEPGWIQTFYLSANLRIQFAYSWRKEDTKVLMRKCQLGNWGEWHDISIGDFVVRQGRAPVTSCDDVTESGFMFNSSSEGVLNILDFPFNSPGWLETVCHGSNILQFAYSWNTNENSIKMRRKQLGTWTNWVTISGDGGGGQVITEIQQEISRDTYNNTFNISTTPTITTDTNGWLQPVDTDTADETGKTDMTGAIMSMLNDTGYCHLAEGIYYVSGSIDMPKGSTLEGCGRGTIIRLLGSVTSGYIARLKEYSTIKGIRFSGGYNDGDVSTPDIGGRKGIIYIGNRDGQEPSVSPSTGKNCQISNCWFENLDSGIYGHNAGGGLQEGLTVSDCYITLCKAGINLDYWTEYCKFTNVVIFKCYYACINNGGNNTFVACTFHGTVGFLIDNINDKSPNSAHGSVIGCTFNHIDNWNNPSTLGGGYAIQVLNTLNGFIFSGCQFFYGQIYIQNSKGIAVSDSLFLGNLVGKITVTGNYPGFFSNNIFLNQPELDVNANTKFDNCRLASNGSLIAV